MRTAALIKQVQRAAPKWSGEDIRELINEVQRIVYSNPVDQMRMFDTGTGKDPLITTTSEKYEYTVSSALTNFDYDAQIVYLVYTTFTDPRGTAVDVETIEATETTAAKIRFIGTDPGASDYFVWAYRRPPAITSNSVQMTIPPQYHQVEVMEAVMALIEKSDNGKSDMLDKFKHDTLPGMLSAMNKSSKDRKGSYTVKRQGY